MKHKTNQGGKPPTTHRKMKHTQGTWAAKDCPIHTTRKRTEIWTSTDQDQPILEIIHNESKMSETKPNAKLIAAAPTLLDAAKKIDSLMQKQGRIRRKYPELFEAWRELNDAITKAEGQDEV